MTKLHTVWKWLDAHFEETILIWLLLMITLLTGAQVVMRRIFLDPLSWSEELCRYCFMWTGFISVAYCVRMRSPIRITTLILILPKAWQKMCDLLTHLISAALFGAFFMASIRIVEKTLASGQTSPALQLPFYLIYLGPALGFGCAVLRLAQAAAQDVGLLPGGPYAIDTPPAATAPAKEDVPCR